MDRQNSMKCKALTSCFMLSQFEWNNLKNLSKKIQDHVKRFKPRLKPEGIYDLYNWSIIHQVKIGYFVPATGKVKLYCSVSTLIDNKCLLVKEIVNDLPLKVEMFITRKYIFYWIKIIRT